MGESICPCGLITNDDDDDVGNNTYGTVSILTW